MLKTSSLASVIVVTELLYASQLIYSVNFKTIQLLIVASAWYIVCTSLLYVGQYYLERHYGRGARTQQDSALQRIRAGLFSLRHARP
jgi:polar amino acid transport system permease protein